MDRACHHAPVPCVVTLAETVLHLRLPHELQHYARRDQSGNRARGQIAGGGGEENSPLMENLTAGFSSTAAEESTSMSAGCCSPVFDMGAAAGVCL